MDLNTKKRAKFKALIGLPPSKQSHSAGRGSKGKGGSKLSPTVEYSSIRKLLEHDQSKIQNRSTRVFKKDVSYMMDKPRPKKLSEAFTFPTDISLVKKMHVIGNGPPSKGPLHFTCPREECLEHAFTTKELMGNSSFKILDDYHRMFLGSPTGRQDILNLRKWFFAMKHKYLKKFDSLDEKEKQARRQDITYFPKEYHRLSDKDYSPNILDDLYRDFSKGLPKNLPPKSSGNANLNKKKTQKNLLKEINSPEKDFTNEIIPEKLLVNSESIKTSKGNTKFLVPNGKSMIVTDDSITSPDNKKKHLIFKSKSSRSNSHRKRKELEKLPLNVMKSPDTAQLTTNETLHISSEIDSYLEDAYLIYSVCAKELIRQVTVDCIERGDLLRKLFNLHRRILLKRDDHFKKINIQLQKDHRVETKKLNDILLLKNKDMNAVVGKMKRKIAKITTELKAAKETEEDLWERLKEAQILLNTESECFNCDVLSQRNLKQHEKILELEMNLNTEIANKTADSKLPEQTPSSITKSTGMKDKTTQSETQQFSKYTQCEGLEEKTSHNSSKLRSFFLIKNFTEKCINKKIGLELIPEKAENTTLRNSNSQNSEALSNPSEFLSTSKNKDRSPIGIRIGEYNNKLDNDDTNHIQGEMARIKANKDKSPMENSSSFLQISSESFFSDSKIHSVISNSIDKSQDRSKQNLTVDPPTDQNDTLKSLPAEEVLSFAEYPDNAQIEFDRVNSSLSQDSNEYIAPTYEENSPKYPISQRRRIRTQFNSDSNQKTALMSLTKECKHKETQTEMVENMGSLSIQRSKKLSKSDILNYMSGTIHEIVKTKTAKSKKGLSLFLGSMQDRRKSCMIPGIDASSLIQNTLSMMNQRTKKITKFSEFNFTVSSNEHAKKQSPAPRIIQNLMKKSVKSLSNYATMSRKFTGRIINQVYLSAITKQKNSDLDLPLLEFTYNEFAQKYGQSAVTEKKFIEFVCSIIKHSELNMCKVFLRLMGVCGKIDWPDYKPKVFLFFVKGFNFILNSKVGIIINPLDSVDKRYCPVSRAIDYVRSETEIFGKSQELIQKIEQASVQDPKKINPNGLIEIDLLLEMACDVFETYLSNVEDTVQILYQTFEWENDEPIELSELLLVIGNFPSGKVHLVPENTNLYWDQVVDLILFKNAVNVNEIQKLFDASKDVNKDEVNKMVKDQYEEYKEIVTRLFSRNTYLFEVWIDRLEDCAFGKREPKLIAFAWKLFTMELNKRNKEAAS